MTTQQTSISVAAPLYADLRVPWHRTNGVRPAKTIHVISIGAVSGPSGTQSFRTIFTDANSENLLSESGYLMSDGLISG
jgi:hypothetical protein